MEYERIFIFVSDTAAFVCMRGSFDVFFERVQGLVALSATKPPNGKEKNSRIKEQDCSLERGRRMAKKKHAIPVLGPRRSSGLLGGGLLACCLHCQIVMCL